MPDSRTIVMAKAPIPGSVKIRLRLDPTRAVRLQEALISDTVEKARGIFPSAPVTVAASPAESLEAVRSLIGPEPELIAQPEGDLGDRMLAGGANCWPGERPRCWCSVPTRQPFRQDTSARLLAPFVQRTDMTPPWCRVRMAGMS
jgi:hypothetical protein